MKSYTQNVKDKTVTYPRLVKAAVNENLIALQVDEDNYIVLNNGNSMHKVGIILSNNLMWKEFTGELVLSND